MRNPESHPESAVPSLGTIIGLFRAKFGERKALPTGRFFAFSFMNRYG
jgi:hypothetical protein